MTDFTAELANVVEGANRAIVAQQLEYATSRSDVGFRDELYRIALRYSDKLHNLAAQDLEVIRDAEGAVDIAKQSLQQELGFIDNTTGAPSPAWGAHLSARWRSHSAKRWKRLRGLRSTSVPTTQYPRRRKALRKAKIEQHQQEIGSLKQALK